MAKMKALQITLCTTLAITVAPAVGFAAENDGTRDPQKKADGSHIEISGTVTTTAPDSFRLDYGSGLITVEMDDWDWYEEEREVLSGDRVRVSGKVDDDTYESASIEAGSVYVESLNTYFHASSADEEGQPFTPSQAPDGRVTRGDMAITGVVTSVGDHEFTMDKGKRKITVETSMMPYNPLDSEGAQQLAIGDWVRAKGRVTRDTFEKKELEAESVTTLRDESRTPPVS